MKRLLAILFSIFMSFSCFSINYVDNIIKAEETSDDYLTFTFLEEGSISLYWYNDSKTSNVMYKLNDEEWKSYTKSDVINVNADDKIGWKANSYANSWCSDRGFTIVGKCNASGNIQSLNNYSDSVNDYAYFELFSECTTLLTAPKLPATNLGNNCYEEMFSGCSSLIKMPELPATTLSAYCYCHMF